MEKRLATATHRILAEYVRDMIRQARRGLIFARLSPFTLYASASEAVAGTGMFRVEMAWEDINRYRDELMDFFRAQDQRDPQSLHLLYYGGPAMSQEPVDPDMIPRFRERRRSVAESIAAVPVDVALLVLLNVILFMVAYASFIRVDVR